MNPAAIIVPDDVTVSFALWQARERGGVLQTNGRRSVIAPALLRGYARIGGRGQWADLDRCTTLAEAVHASAPDPEAA